MAKHCKNTQISWDYQPKTAQITPNENLIFRNLWDLCRCYVFQSKDTVAESHLEDNTKKIGNKLHGHCTTKTKEKTR